MMIIFSPGDYFYTVKMLRYLVENHISVVINYPVSLCVSSLYTENALKAVWSFLLFTVIADFSAVLEVTFQSDNFFFLPFPSPPQPFFFSPDGRC